ncbi:hypothetical protein D3C73_1593340 [compost metagenome]
MIIPTVDLDRSAHRINHEFKLACEPIGRHHRVGIGKGEPLRSSTEQLFRTGRPGFPDILETDHQRADFQGSDQPVCGV